MSGDTAGYLWVEYGVSLFFCQEILPLLSLVLTGVCPLWSAGLGDYVLFLICNKKYLFPFLSPMKQVVIFELL